MEDADFDGWCCDPPNEGFAVFLDTYRRVLAGRGGDHAIGRKLHRYFLAAGIPVPQVDLVQPVHEGEAKTPMRALGAEQPVRDAGGFAHLAHVRAS